MPGISLLDSVRADALMQISSIKLFLEPMEALKVRILKRINGQWNRSNMNVESTVMAKHNCLAAALPSLVNGKKRVLSLRPDRMNETCTLEARFARQGNTTITMTANRIGSDNLLKWL